MRLILLLLMSSLALADGYTKDGFAPIDSLEFGKIADAQTTDATETVVSAMTMPDPATWLMKVTCEARKSDGTKREGFVKSALVFRSGGGATIEGDVVNNFTQSGVSYAVTIGVSSNDLQVKVTGAASETVDWRCSFTKQSLE